MLKKAAEIQFFITLLIIIFKNFEWFDDILFKYLNSMDINFYIKHFLEISDN